MKVKPEYEQKTLNNVKQELNNALSEIVSADLRISLLNTYSNNSLKEAYKIIREVLTDINKLIKEKND